MNLLEGNFVDDDFVLVFFVFFDLVMSLKNDCVLFSVICLSDFSVVVDDIVSRKVRIR